MDTENKLFAFLIGALSIFVMWMIACSIIHTYDPDKGKIVCGQSTITNQHDCIVWFRNGKAAGK